MIEGRLALLRQAATNCHEEFSPRIARIDTKKTKKLVQIGAIRGKENVASRHELHELTRKKTKELVKIRVIRGKEKVLVRVRVIRGKVETERMHGARRLAGWC